MYSNLGTKEYHDIGFRPPALGSLLWKYKYLCQIMAKMGNFWPEIFVFKKLVNIFGEKWLKSVKYCMHTEVDFIHQWSSKTA
jgi:hypothetical protein